MKKLERELIQNQIIEYQQNPSLFSKQILGSVLWHKQTEILESVRDNKRTTVRSCNAAGKTRTAAEVVLWYMNTFFPAIVITTAPTFAQIESILWKEIKTLHANAKLKLGGTVLNTEYKITDNAFAMGISTNETDRFQGWHSPNLLVVLDEASGIKSKIWEAAEGLHPHRWLVIGNPIAPVGDFADTFKSDLWNKITINAWETPNVLAGKVIVPGLVTKEWCEERKKEWGEDNPLYQARVLGNFPTASEDTLIPLNFIESAVNRELTAEREIWTIGVDVARYGDCSTVIYVWDGFKVRDERIINKSSTTEVVGNIIDVYRENNLQGDPIVVDEPGIGGGTIDLLREQGYNVRGINGGAKAQNEEKFYNCRAEMYFKLKDRFVKETISIPNDSKLIADLAAIRYELDSHGRLKIVSKEELMKEGFRSPDRSDALALANYWDSDILRNRGYIRQPKPPLSMAHIRHG